MYMTFKRSVLTIKKLQNVFIYGEKQLENFDKEQKLAKNMIYYMYKYNILIDD